LPPSEQPARGRSRREDTHREGDRPSPATPPSRNWRWRHLRPARRRYARTRRFRCTSTVSWPLLWFRKQHPRPFGENGVDQRKLQTDRPQICVAGRRRSQRRRRRGARVGSVFSARAHPDSVAGVAAGDRRFRSPAGRITDAYLIKPTEKALFPSDFAEVGSDWAIHVVKDARLSP
jgi:hypothetical protein